MATETQNQTFEPFKPSTKFTKDCACHKKKDIQNHLSFRPAPANVSSKVLKVPHPDSTTPATQMKKGPMSCACHTKLRSRPTTPATKIICRPKKEQRPPGNKETSKTGQPLRASLRGAVEMDMGISQGNLCANWRKQQPAPTASTLIEPLSLPLLREPLNGDTLLGKKKKHKDQDFKSQKRQEGKNHQSQEGTKS